MARSELIYICNCREFQCHALCCLLVGGGHVKSGEVRLAFPAADRQYCILTKCYMSLRHSQASFLPAILPTG